MVLGESGWYMWIGTELGSLKGTPSATVFWTVVFDLEDRPLPSKAVHFYANEPSTFFAGSFN